MVKRKDTPTSLDKLLNTGHEAAIDESLIDDTAIPDKQFYVIKLSENGLDALLELATIGVLEYQRDSWEKYVIANQVAPDGEIYADIGAQEALYAVQNMQKFNYPILADTEAASYAYNTPLDPDSYYQWRTVGDIKATMPYVPINQLQDSSGNDLPDDFPIVLLAPRKYGGFGGVVFYHDDWPDTDNWAAYFTKASDFINTEHPEYHDWLIENGGYVSDTDLILQIHLTRQHFLNSQYVIDFIINIIQQNIATLNLFNTTILVPHPSAPPGGSWPPGTSAPPDPTTTPPAYPGYTDHVVNCVDNNVSEWQGCSELVLAQELGFTPLPTLPIPVMKYHFTDIKSTITGAIQLNNIVTDITKVTEVEICVDYGCLSEIEVSALTFRQAAMRSKLPKFTIIKDNTSTPPNETYSATIPPTDNYITGLFKFKLPEVPVTLQAKAITAISQGDNTIIFEDWQHIAEIDFDMELMPSIFGADNNPFEEQSLSPFVSIGIKRVREQPLSWRGVSVNISIDTPCTVGDFSPGFLQDSYGFDWTNQQGDTQYLFSSNNWINTIEAVLLEVYSPPAGQSLWMPPSGSNNQAIMDSWLAVNPLQPRDFSNNMLLYSEWYSVNQIMYSWLKVPAGQTFFAFDMYPVPFNGWVKLVGIRYANGTFRMQDITHKCGSLLYPEYPAYPY